MQPPDDVQQKMTKVAGETVVLDGQIFKNTHFKNCILIYRGGTLPVLHSNYFDECSWRFEDHAGRMLEFLRAFAGAGASSRDFVLKELLGVR